MSADKTGDRMKEEYEAATRLLLPRKTHTIIRLDGNAFHTYTRGLARPFDAQLHDDLVSSAAFLCAKVSGARLAYVQSDEVSLLVTDFTNPGTQPWFGGNVQKMASVSASILTAKFNELRPPGVPLAFFDSRVFMIADASEVEEYFRWRFVDARRNSVSSLAQAHFSHRELQNRSTFEQQSMLLKDRGVSWTDQDPQFKYGTVIYRDQRTEDVTFTRDGKEYVARDVTRHTWEAVPASHDVLIAHLEPCLLR